MSDRRNPYLILGVDYGCTRQEAAKAFARVSRRLRRSTGERFTIEDANWALHQIEHAIEDPTSAIVAFRVPADPDVFESRVGSELTRPRPLPRTTEPSEEAVDQLRAEALGAVLAEDLGALAELGLALCYYDPDSP